MPFCYVPDQSFKKCYEKPYIFRNTIDFKNTNDLNSNMNYCHTDDDKKDVVRRACEKECVVKQIATPVPSKYKCNELSQNDIFRFAHECDSAYCRQECSPADRRCINQCPIDCQRVKVCQEAYLFPNKCRISICADSIYPNNYPINTKPGTGYVSNNNQFCYHYDEKLKKYIYKTK